MKMSLRASAIIIAIIAACYFLPHFTRRLDWSTVKGAAREGAKGAIQDVTRDTVKAVRLIVETVRSNVPAEEKPISDGGIHE